MKTAAKHSGIHQSDMRAWLAEHHRGIGGSESAALLGQNGYKSALAVYWEKVNAPAYDPEEEDGQEHLTWGRVLEEPILREFGRRQELPIEMGGELLWSKKYPHMLATLDAYIPTDRPRFAECKTTAMGHRYPKPNDPTDEKEIPMEVQIQIQQGLCVTGFFEAFAVWLPMPERTLGHRLIKPHSEFQHMLGEAIEEFWAKHVERRIPPAPDGSESSKATIAAMYPEPCKEAIELGEEWLARKLEYEKLKREAKVLDSSIEKLKQEMQVALGKHTGAVLPDNSMITYNRISPKPSVCSGCGHETPRKSFRKLGFKKSAPRSVEIVEPKSLPEPAPAAQIIDLCEALRQSIE